jgi:hypothetical protein
MTDKQFDFQGEAQPAPRTGTETINYSDTFSPVTVKETVGATFLGILSLIFAIALLRALARNRKLEVQLARLTAKEQS